MERLERLAAKERRRVVGLISGTSVDGVDAVLVELGAGGDFRVLGFCTHPIPAPLRQQVFALFADDASLDLLCQVNFALGELFAEAALAVIASAGLEPFQVDLVGSHGQTVRHLPAGSPPSTLQIGEPAVIAARTGLVAVADFRPADMAVGGQGAPLVPLADWRLCGHSQKGRLLLNIGGIANVTVLPAGCAAGQVRAFDLGPGNMLMDAAASHFTGGRERCDRDGERALRGRVDQALLSRLMEHPFLAKAPPKSTGREEFGEAFFRRLLRESALGEDDMLATLTAFSARAIALGIERFCAEGMEELWIGGGGVHNIALRRLIEEALPWLRVGSLAELGVDPDAREALCFAVLADETLRGLPGNLPSATGASRPAVLGKIALP